MGIINFISELFNRDVVRQFDEIRNNHIEALRLWTSNGYRTKRIIPKCKRHLFDKAESDYKEFQQLFKHGNTTNYDEYLYKQKVVVVAKIDIILNLYNIYTYNEGIDMLFNSLKNSYPIAMRYFAEKYLGVYINDLDIKENLVSGREGLVVTYSDLEISPSQPTKVTSIINITIEQREELTSHKDEFAKECTRIANIIARCKATKEQELIHNIFVENVLNNERRNHWYQAFMSSKGTESEEYCIDNLKNLDQYIACQLEQQYNELKNQYPEGINWYDEQNEFIEGDHLEGVDYWEDCIHQKDEIRKQHNITLHYQKLLKKYPNGISGYKETHKVFDDNLCCCFVPSKEEIVNLGDEKLSELEKLSLSIQDCQKWIKEQKEYAQFVRNIHDECMPNWGCYYYDIVVKYQTFSNHPSENDFRIWEHYCESYCSDSDLDYTHFQGRRNAYVETIPQLEECRCRFTQQVYDKIMNYVCKVKKQYGKVLVLFGDSNVQNEEFNNYHFDYLKNLLEEKSIDYRSTINKDAFSHLYRHIIIVEVISTNAHLKEQCYSVISAYREQYPLISYISLEKELDREEMQELISKKNAKLKAEQEAAEKAERKRRIREQQEQEKLRFAQLEAQRKEQEKKDLLNCVSNWYVPTRSSLRCFSMYNYYPTTCDFEADEEEWAVRNLIWNFKANPNKPMPLFNIMHLHRQAAQNVSAKMCMCLRKFFGDSISKLTLVCIPSSKQEVTQRRYEDFSSMICTNLGMENAYSYIHVTEDGEASHLGGNVHAQISIDSNFFRGKYVLLFDDVITSGRSMENFKYKLEHLGAKVIAGFSIGRTVHNRLTCNPIDNLEEFMPHQQQSYRATNNEPPSTLGSVDDLPF